MPCMVGTMRFVAKPIGFSIIDYLWNGFRNGERTYNFLGTKFAKSLTLRWQFHTNIGIANFTQGELEAQWTKRLIIHHKV